MLMWYIHECLWGNTCWLCWSWCYLILIQVLLILMLIYVSELCPCVVVKKLYFFKNIAVNSSASIREIKLKVIMIMDVYTNERFILWHKVWPYKLCLSVSFEKEAWRWRCVGKGKKIKGRVVKYMITFLWCVFINSKLIDRVYGIKCGFSLSLLIYIYILGFLIRKYEPLWQELGLSNTQVTVKKSWPLL